MNATESLHDLGQSLWLDNITRTLLTSGTLSRYIQDLSVTGLTSNPTIFEHAIGRSDSYDASIRVLAAAGLSDEDIFFELALEDLTEAADLFRPAFEASDGVDGWASFEVSPLLADNTAHTVQAANRLCEKATKANLFIKIPGTPAAIEAIEQVVFDGVPVNVTLLFSCEQVLAAADAYLRGLERRLAAGVHLKVASVLWLFVSRWDVAVKQKIASPFHNRRTRVLRQDLRCHGKHAGVARDRRSPRDRRIPAICREEPAEGCGAHYRISGGRSPHRGDDIGAGSAAFHESRSHGRTRTTSSGLRA
jgi:transaldolase